MKRIILHEKYTNNPITIRLDAIDNITETITVSLGNYSIDVSEDITTIMDKIKEAEGSITLEHMRDATPEEQKSTKDYIKSISKPTGFHFDTLEQTELKPSYSSVKSELEQQPCEGAVSKNEAINSIKYKSDVEKKLRNQNRKYTEGYDDVRWIKGYEDGLDDAITIINSLPSAQSQPCEDCISREAVRELICQNNDKYGYSDRFHEFTEKCLHLPSVTPQILEPCEDAVSREYIIEHLNICSLEGGRPYWTTSEIIDLIKELPTVTPTNEDMREAYIKGYDYGVKDWFKSKTESCEDAVSRDAVINAICAWGTNKERNSEVMIPMAEVKQSIADIVADLPSVTPQRMQGEWIEIFVETPNDPYNYGFKAHKCSKCEYRPFQISDYCPNCGAEMSRGEEE